MSLLTAAAAPAPDRRAWITQNAASTRYGLSRKTVAKVIARGGVRTLVLPGISPRYSAEDLDRLFAASIKSGK